MELSRVGKYEVKQLLGKGATGSVYLASDPFGQRDVAIKVLEKLSKDPEEARRQLRFFQNEAALSKYCGADALLDPMSTVEIGYKCCKALEFANTLGVVHRDMKPANILTRGMDSGELDIKVADFGAAQLARSDVTQVSGVGSPAYMSPEQLKGEEIDFRTDMFSLGGVLYHLLTGRKPFDGRTAYDLMERILSTVPPAPSSLRP